MAPIAISAKEVQEQLRTVTRSKLFAQSPRQALLLEYLCSKVLLGRQDEIKESMIALEVFGRKSTFDDKKDAIVRVDAHRLRQRLAKYYATEGAKDPVIIELAPGGYIPKFTPALSRTEPAAPVTIPPPPEKRARLNLNPAATWAAGLVFLLAGSVLLARWNYLAPRPASPRVETAGASPVLLGPPVPGIRLLAGSGKSYTDRAGHLWQADRYFKGGSAERGPSDFLGTPPDPSLYRFMRYGDFSYDIPAPAAVYELRLYFAEPNFRSGTDVGNEGGENQRHFTVFLNDRELLHDFDAVTDAGRFPVDVRAFRGITPAADGFVHLRFQAVVGPPFVNAIELVQGVSGQVLPIRIRASDSSFTDHAGNVWSPDDYYIGGRLATHKGDVTRTADPDLYASERYGNFSYSIPVPPGRYAVTLYFAETFWDSQPGSPRNGGTGARVFSVSCNGVALLQDFDLLAVDQPFRPVIRTFHNLKPNGQGKLLLSFSPENNYASVKAIEVAEETTSSSGR